MNDDTTTAFSAYVFSNASKKLYPDNKPEHFKVHLPKPISLSGDWEVGVSMLGFENTWHNIKTECVFKVTFSVEKDKVAVVDSYECKFKPGYYENAELVIWNINLLIRNGMSEYITRQTSLATTIKIIGTSVEGETDEITRLAFGKLELNKEMGRVKIVSKNPTFEITIVEGREIWAALGVLLETTSLKPTDGFAFAPAMNMHLPTLFIYSPIIEYQSVGDTSAPLLALAPIQGGFGSYCFYKYDRPLYCKVAHNYISDLEFQILDHRGTEVPLGKAVTFLLLLFRKRT